MEIRELNHVDAPSYVQLKKELNQEASNHSQVGEDDYKKAFKEVLNARRSICFGGEENGALVGWVTLKGDSDPIHLYCAELEIGVSPAYQGQGIGKALINRAIKWAQDHDFRRVELTVHTKNKRALWLFSGVGFSVEGTRRHSYKNHDQWLDEFYMGLLLKHTKSERD